MKRTGREVRLIRRPDRIARPEDFAVVRTTVPDASEGEILIRNLVLSVDPVMRGQMNALAPLGEAMRGAVIGVVLQSRRRDFDEGDLVLHYLSCREFALSDGQGVSRLPPTTDLPVTVHLHALGMTGFTAYGGLLDIARILPGETLYVSAAAGAVGSVAAQVARNLGCRVVASAGSEEKLAWLRDVAGIETVFNHHEAPVSTSLPAAAPQGLDVYFDNVGGQHLDAALASMNDLGRVAICGAIAAYDGAEAPVHNLPMTIYRRVTLRGFVMADFPHLREAFERDMTAWLRSGMVRYAETLMHGLDSFPSALVGLLEGKNLGKMLVQIE